MFHSGPYITVPHYKFYFSSGAV